MSFCRKVLLQIPIPLKVEPVTLASEALDGPAPPSHLLPPSAPHGAPATLASPLALFLLCFGPSVLSVCKLLTPGPPHSPGFNPERLMPATLSQPATPASPPVRVEAPGRYGPSLCCPGTCLCRTGTRPVVSELFLE